MSKIENNHKPFQDIEFKSLIIAFKGMLIIFFIVISLILIFSIKSVAISQDLNYNFENHYIYNSDNINYTTFNRRNSSVYSGHYNASYSFEKDILDSKPNYWITIDNINCYTSIVNWQNHDKVVLIYDNNNTHYSEINNYFSGINNGTLEGWFSSNDTSQGTYIYFSQEGNRRGGIHIIDNYIKYFDSDWNSHIIMNAINNQWYYYRIDFNCTSDTYDIYINGNLELSDINFSSGGSTEINRIILMSRSTSYNYNSYFDAIGCSWFDNYTVGQNLIPLLDYQDSIYEVDKCEFAYNITTLEPNTLDSENIDNNWNEFDDDSKAHVKTSGVYDEIDIDYLIVQNQDQYGIYKEFDYNNTGIFDISFDITSMDLFNPHLDGWYFNINSYNDTLLVSLLFNATATTDILLYYYNGSSYIYLHEIQNILHQFSLNIYIDIFVVLKLNDDDVNYIWYFPKLTDNIGINTIEVIGADNDDIGDYASISIDSIGLYINGSSYLPDDLYSTIIDTDIEQWKENIHNIFEINADGYFSFSIYYGGVYWYNLFTYNFFDNENKRIIEYGLDIFKGSENYTFVLISNVSFTISEIKVYSNSLKENSNIYYPSFTYNGVDIQENYFYIANNRLYYKHTANQNDTLEYIQVSFNIADEYCLNSSVNFGAYFLGISKMYFTLNYVSETNSTFTIPLGYKNYNVILPQQQIIKMFTFLITDNNDNDNYGNSNGYFSSITLNYYVDIELTILTLSLIEILIPLIVLIIPTLAIASVYGKKAIIPMLLLMSVICFIGNLIEPELFFIIMLCLGSAIFLQYKIERGKQ